MNTNGTSNIVIDDSTGINYYPSTTTASSGYIYSYPYYNYHDSIRDWLEGFLADKTHLTKDQTLILKKKLGLDDS